MMPPSVPPRRPPSSVSALDATLDVETPEHILLTYTLAGFGSRALAALIDTIILIILMIGLGVAMVTLMADSGVGQWVGRAVGSGRWAVAVVVLLEFMLFWGYFVCWEGINDGQTPGKMLLKLRVVRDGGYSVTFASSAVRNLVRILDAQPGFSYAVGSIAVLATKSGKRLGDLLAGTFVVHEGRIAYDHHVVPKVLASEIVMPMLRDEEYDLLERYVARRNQLTPERCRVLAAQVAERLTPHLDPEHAGPAAALVALFDRERTARAASVAGRSDSGTQREQHAIVALGLPRWNAFAVSLAEIRRTGLSKMSAADVSDFVERYRQLTSDLARLHTASRGRTFDALFFVRRLVAGGHAILYRRRERRTAGIIRYLTADVPHEIRRSAGAVLLAATLFFAPAIAAYTVVVHTPATAASFVPPVMIERANRGQERLQRGEGYVTIPKDERPIAASFIITNNIQISYMAFASGLTAGIGTMLLLIVNGVQLGGSAGIFAVKGVASLLWAFVAPHGVLELSAICLAGGGGLLIASAIVLPGDMTRREALVLRGRRALALVVAATLFLAVAGTIEGLISPRVWPIQWKIAVSVATAIAMGGYLSLGWRPSTPVTTPPGL